MIPSDKERFNEAYAYYINHGESPSNARELAMGQICWEDEQSEENRWKGANDSMPISPYAC